MENNKLLEMFGVNSYAELHEYIENNPDDEEVIRFKELIAELLKQQMWEGNYEYIYWKDEEK